MRGEVAAVSKRNAPPQDQPQASVAPSDDRAADIRHLLRAFANAADILQAASDGIASLQKWTRVACGIAELMREASNAFEVANQAVGTPEPAPQALLASLVVQYNGVLEQIDAVARDAARNDVNLLMGDTLTLAFDETGTSTLSMTGTVCDAAGLGLAPLSAGSDVQAATDTILGTLRAANAALRAQARTMSAHLVIVRSRQQFFGNLQEMRNGGSSGAIKASTSEEAANSLALSTRQAIATSALALAQESQASILRLLNRSNFFGQGN
jgi:flagellin